MLDHSDKMTDDQLKELKTLATCKIHPANAYLTREASVLKKRIYIVKVKNFIDGRPTNKVN